MSRAAADLRARAGAIQARDRPAPVDEIAPPPRPVEARTRPVRQTVDLPPEQHASLAAWRLDTALQLGRTRLTTQDVLAAVIDVLLDDDTVARRVRARLEDDST